MLLLFISYRTNLQITLHHRYIGTGKHHSTHRAQYCHGSSHPLGVLEHPPLGKGHCMAKIDKFTEREGERATANMTENDATPRFCTLNPRGTFLPSASFQNCVARLFPKLSAIFMTVKCLLWLLRELLSLLLKLMFTVVEFDLYLLTYVVK